MVWVQEELFFNFGLFKVDEWLKILLRLLVEQVVALFEVGLQFWRLYSLASIIESRVIEYGQQRVFR